MMTFRVLNLFLFEQGGTEGIMIYILGRYARFAARAGDLRADACGVLAVLPPTCVSCRCQAMCT
jgi:hypothetical protein